MKKVIEYGAVVEVVFGSIKGKFIVIDSYDMQGEQWYTVRPVDKDDIATIEAITGDKFLEVTADDILSA